MKLIAIAAILSAAVATSVDPIDIEEWPVPWEKTRPRDPYVGPEGKVWFVGQTGHYVAYLVPETGEFKRYDLDPGTGPHNLIVDTEGFVWYAGNRASHIGKLDPKTGEITKYPTPEVRDPHTLVFDGKGNIWFTAQGANIVGKLVMKTGEVRIIEAPTPRARPYGIKIDAQGRPWIAEVGTNKLGTVDPATLEYREYALPREGARPRRLEITSDDKIWAVDFAGGYLVRFDPATGAFQEWAAPSGAESRPYGMALDDQDRVWFVETGPSPNRFVGFDTRTREFFSITDVPSGGGTVRHMYYHAPTRAIWFGTDTNNIGRALVPAGHASTH